MTCPRHPLLAAVALWVALALPAQAGTEAAAFAVALEAPAALRPLLEQHLRILQERDDPRLTRARFRFLVRGTPEEVRDLLATEGYFSPSIDHSVEATASGWLARIKVDPGQPARVVGVDLGYQGEFAQVDAAFSARSKALAEAWPLPPGAVFLDRLWTEGKAALLRDLQRVHYPAARLSESLAEVDPDRHAVSLRLQLDSGPRFRFGEVEVSGLETLPAQIVAGLNPIRPGSPYQEQDLEDFRHRLQGSGYFSSVYVTASQDPKDAAAAPIRVSVTEDTRRELGVGAGFSTDKGAGVELRYEDNLTWRPGWRSTSSLKLEQLEQSATAHLYLVPIARGFQPVISAELKHSEVQDDDIVTARVIGQLRRSSADDELSLSLDLNYEWNRAAGSDEHDITSVPLNLSWTRRVLDDRVFPRRGYAVNLQAGGALEGALSNTSFLRLYARGNLYLPVGAGGVLLMRGEIGAVEASTREDIPADYLFRAGGSQSVRGYEYDSLGVDENGAIMPGRYLGVASIELMYPLVPGWLGAVFVDAGNAVDRVGDYEARYGYGAGIRWRSPLGPLNLDVAYGEAEASWRIHFSVGSLF